MEEKSGAGIVKKLAPKDRIFFEDAGVFGDDLHEIPG
jgi:hypothetical protein